MAVMKNGRYAAEITEARRASIVKALAETDGNRARAAKLLGISRAALIARLKALKVDGIPYAPTRSWHFLHRERPLADENDGVAVTTMEQPSALKRLDS